MSLEEILTKTDFLPVQQYRVEWQTKNEQFLARIIFNDLKSVQKELHHNINSGCWKLVNYFMWFVPEWTKWHAKFQDLTLVGHF
jgi:hypothetical protein